MQKSKLFYKNYKSYNCYNTYNTLIALFVLLGQFTDFLLSYLCPIPVFPLSYHLYFFVLSICIVLSNFIKSCVCFSYSLYQITLQKKAKISAKGSLCYSWKVWLNVLNLHLSTFFHYSYYLFLSFV